VPSKTSAAGSDGTLIATEAQVNLKANLADPVFTGVPKVPAKKTAANSTTAGDTLIATESQVALKANIDSPVFTGTPKVPSKISVAGSNGTLIATEAQVKAVADVVDGIINPPQPSGNGTLVTGANLKGFQTATLTLRRGWYRVVLSAGGGGCVYDYNYGFLSPPAGEGGYLDMKFFIPYDASAKLMSGEGGYGIGNGGRGGGGYGNGGKSAGAYFFDNNENPINKGGGAGGGGSVLSITELGILYITIGGNGDGNGGGLGGGYGGVNNNYENGSDGGNNMNNSTGGGGWGGHSRRGGQIERSDFSKEVEGKAGFAQLYEFR
jgi:hypothetical protein